MSQVLVWVLAILASWDAFLRLESSRIQIDQSLRLRRELMKSPYLARQTYCKDAAAWEGVRVLWRAGESWTSACSSGSLARGLPRYWRIETRLKYGMLFLLELPITFSIVILA